MKLKETEKQHWLFPDEHITEELYDALDEALGNLERQKIPLVEKQLLAIIKKCPDHIDALHHLSLIYGETGRDVESYIYAQAAVGVGFQAFPSTFSWSKSRLEWGFTSNRPFLRAYHNLGLWFFNHKQYDGAIEIFGRLLAVSPNDNLGVRYILPECWFAQDKPELVLAHCKTWSEDCSPEIQYTYCLALVACDQVDAAKKLLTGAIGQFPLVAKELLKTAHRRPKSSFPGTITLGGADQAYDYWHQYGKYWSSSVLAMNLLKECYK